MLVLLKPRPENLQQGQKHTDLPQNSFFLNIEYLENIIVMFFF